MSMSLSAWTQRYEQLAQIRGKPPRRPHVSHTHPNTALRDWLAHQKALRALGAPPQRPQCQGFLLGC